MPEQRSDLVKVLTPVVRARSIEALGWRTILQDALAAAADAESEGRPPHPETMENAFRALAGINSMVRTATDAATALQGDGDAELVAQYAAWHPVRHMHLYAPVMYGRATADPKASPAAAADQKELRYESSRAEKAVRDRPDMLAALQRSLLARAPEERDRPPVGAVSQVRQWIGEWLDRHDTVNVMESAAPAPLDAVLQDTDRRTVEAEVWHRWLVTLAESAVDASDPEVVRSVSAAFGRLRHLSDPGDLLEPEALLQMAERPDDLVVRTWSAWSAVSGIDEAALDTLVSLEAALADDLLNDAAAKIDERHYDAAALVAALPPETIEMLADGYSRRNATVDTLPPSGVQEYLQYVRDGRTVPDPALIESVSAASDASVATVTSLLASDHSAFRDEVVVDGVVVQSAAAPSRGGFSPARFADQTRSTTGRRSTDASPVIIPGRVVGSNVVPSTGPATRPGASSTPSAALERSSTA